MFRPCSPDGTAVGIATYIIFYLQQVAVLAWNMRRYGVMATGVHGRVRGGAEGTAPCGLTSFDDVEYTVCIHDKLITAMLLQLAVV